MKNDQSSQELKDKIKNLVSQKNYPCIGALRAVKMNDLRVGIYQNFGSGNASKNLFQDLLLFLKEQKESNSPYLSFWAAFPNDPACSEEEFEKKLWNELSAVASFDTEAWDPQWSQNPEEKNFCFSLGGSAFFVVGLHPNSSRLSRQFDCPSLVFNLYEQFEIISRLGQYESMVEINRKKAHLFEESVNPMVEKYGDQWEAIQFSGRQNDSSWKCPFHKTNSSL